MIVIKSLTKVLFIMAGFICLGLGIVGIILPVLPTTPLLLLATFCFVKGSKKFEVWFKETKIYKKYVENFIKNKSMTLKQKVSINVFADCMIAIPFFILDSLWVKILLILIVIYKYYYFITQIKTIRD